ncbi:hypothetical protein AB674_18490 [Flavobacterium sp. ABG]|nr:hypothetical protein AB674_18490 [Flavobacterium sp. ABG]
MQGSQRFSFARRFSRLGRSSLTLEKNLRNLLNLREKKLGIKLERSRNTIIKLCEPCETLANLAVKLVIFYSSPQ